MKRAVMITGVTVLALTLGAVGASAKGFGDHGGKGGPRGPQINFEQIDANADGLITKEELAAHAKARFDEQDTNGDGTLTVEELRAAAEKMRENRMQRMLERRDANNDGVLSFDEMQPQGDRADRMFERLDKNGDGQISAEEFAELKMKRGGPGRGEGPRGGHGDN